MISYFGAKSKMSEWIYNYIPKDIKTFAEPFSGAMWVYTTPKLDYSHVDNIIYNDYNRHMANLFACLREHKKFLFHIENEIENGFLKTDKTGDDYKQFYKDIFYSFKHDKSDGNFLDNPPVNIPNFDAGVKYAFLLTSTFNGVFPRSGGYSGISGTNKIKLYALINKLKKKEYQNKLDKITNVHSLDFEELIKKYDSEDTFFYLDPPYFSDNEDGTDTGLRASWYGMKDSFNYQTHMRLLNLLKTTKSRWALSYYYFNELEDHLPKDKYTWVQKDFFRSSASFSDNKDTKGTELLIMNYELSPEEIEENKKFLNSNNKPVTRKKAPIKNSNTATKNNSRTKMKEEFIDFEDLLLNKSFSDIDEEIKYLENAKKQIDKKLAEKIKEAANNIIPDTPKEVEDFIDEIEKENGGAFINSEQAYLDNAEKQSEAFVEKVKDLVSKQQDIEPEFKKVVDDNFWDLVDTNEPVNELVNEPVNVEDEEYFDSSLANEINSDKYEEVTNNVVTNEEVTNDDDEIDDFWK